MTQLNRSDSELEPINLGLPILKELGAKWLVEIAEHFADNPQIIVNGFIRSGITGALSNDPVDDRYSLQLRLRD